MGVSNGIRQSEHLVPSPSCDRHSLYDPRQVPPLLSGCSVLACKMGVLDFMISGDFSFLTTHEQSHPVSYRLLEGGRVLRGLGSCGCVRH